MSLEKATKEKFPETGQTKTFQLDSKAMTQYALGSSKLIASLLIIPDTFALIPNSLNFTSWALKLVGLWISAAVLWFVSFNGILQLVKLLTSGVRVSKDGIYQWRLAKLIRWQDIEAVAVEERAVFSRIFFLTPKAKRLTLFVAKGQRLVPNYLPSFLFSKETFDEIIKTVTSEKFGVKPDSNECIFATDAGARKMAATNRLLSWQRFMVSGIVAISLIMFLGRKAFVNYSYNCGNKAISHERFDVAKQYYEQAVAADPAFAFGWESLARAQLALGRFDDAKKDWSKALFLKPDYVEAQLGLAQLALRSGRLSEAKFLIDQALNLAPQNKRALLTLSTYDWRIGHVIEAEKLLVKTLEQDSPHSEKLSHEAIYPTLGEDNQIAFCLLGNLDISQQRTKDARDKVEFLRNVRKSKYTLLLYNELLARCLQSEKKEDQALELLNQSIQSTPEDVPLNNIFLSIALHHKNYSLAKQCLIRLDKNKNEDLETFLMEARFYIWIGEIAKAQKMLVKIAASKTADANTLNETAALLSKIGAREHALDAAAKAIMIHRYNQNFR